MAHRCGAERLNFFTIEMADNFVCQIVTYNLHGLICLREVSALLQPVSLSLQAVGTDLVEALSSNDATLSVLKQWRCQCETVFSKLFSEVTAMASDLDMHVTKPQIAKMSVYRCNAACDSTGGVEDYYRINVFNPMLDQVIADLSHRFADHQRQSLLLTHLMPHSAPKWLNLLWTNSVST